MPTSSSKTLSPAELAKLEHAFAADPASDAYKALAEAYLAMGRYMEAMVVCKKGVKAHPSSAEPRVLLARVYAEQGKDKKALEELTAALGVAPNDKAALRMTGALQLKSGEAEAGKASLLKAWQADPADPETLELLNTHGIPPPAAAVPVAAAPVPAAPVVAAAPMAAAAPVAAAPVAAAPVAGPGAQGAGGPPVLVPNAAPAAAPVAPGVWAQQSAPHGTGAAPAQAPQPQRTVSHPAAPAARAPAAPRPAAPRPQARSVRPSWDDDDDAPDEDELPRRRSSKKSSSGQKSFFFALLVIAPVLIGGYYYWTQHQARVNREIKKQLDVATEELKHDSYASYKKACDAADAVLNLDPDSVAAHGYLAYAWAIRWGEHGGGDEARQKAEEHLRFAEQGRELSSQLIAAEALFQTYSGHGAQALQSLEERVKSLEEQGKRSSLLALTLGIIQMNAGDLEAARASLEKAQALAPDDPRVYAAMGTLYRRLGQDNQAWKNYDFALRYEKDHPESLLGKALVLLEQDDPDYYVEAAKMIKKLLEADPPPSPRQLATAQLARAFLISRVTTDLSSYVPDFQKKLLDGTGVPADRKAAQAELAKAEEEGFSLDRTNPELHLIKGRRLFNEGQIDQSVDEIRTAIKMDGTRAQFYVELARALMAKKGGEKEAQEALATAIKTMGQSPKLVLMLGQAFERQGQLDKAIEQYRLSVGDGKQRAPEARLALGAALRQKRDYAGALENLEKAAQEFVTQPSRVAAAYTELARALEDKGDREKAGETYQKALKADPDYADQYYFFARYLAGDKANAAKAKIAAAEYLKLAPRGDYAQDAQRLAQ